MHCIDYASPRIASLVPLVMASSCGSCSPERFPSLKCLWFKSSGSVTPPLSFSPGRALLIRERRHTDSGTLPPPIREGRSNPSSVLSRVGSKLRCCIADVRHSDFAYCCQAVAECDERPELPSTFPAGFRAIVEQCWQRDPEQRPSWRDIITQVQTCDLDLQTPVEKTHSSSNRDDDDVEPSLLLVATAKSSKSSHGGRGFAGGILSAGPDGLLQSQGSWNHEIKRGLDTLRERYHRRIGIASKPLLAGRRSSNLRVGSGPNVSGGGAP